MEKKLLRRGEYEVVELKNYAEAEHYFEDYKLCYMHREHKFAYYQSEGRGKIYLCMREGYKEEPRPVVPRGQRFDRYDAYASSIIGVCLNEDGSVKAINSRYIWRVGGTDHDYTKEEVMYLLGDKASEVFK